LKLAGTSGQGAATINVTASPNDAAAARTGAITVNDQRLDFTQEGRGCTIGLSGPNGAVASSGAHGSLVITTLAGCPWTVTTSAPWVVPSTASGSGATTIAYDVQANADAAREAVISVGAATFTVSQDAAPTAAACSFTLDQTTRDFTAAGGNGAVSVTSQPDCSWSVTGGASWITVASTAGGGNGTVTYTVAANTAPVARNAALTIAGRVYTVTQQGIACTISIAPPTQTFAAAGGNGTVQITAPAGCAWTASSSTGWAQLGATSGTGSTQLPYQVLSNTDTASRMAIVTIAGQTLTITQNGTSSSCSYDVTPATRNFVAAGGNATVHVASGTGCAWTAVSNMPWITIPSQDASGSGTADVAYAVSSNTTTTTRSGTITIGGKVHTVTQDAAAATCTYDVTPPTRNFVAAGGSAMVHVTTGNSCAWTAVSNMPWITIPPQGASGSGTADITYTVASNSTTTTRSGTVTVGGAVHTVTQDATATACTYVLSPTERSFQPAGGNGTVTVTTGPTCPWTATSSAGFVTILTPSGTVIGSGTITYSVASAGDNVDRTATITVDGQVHTITQKRTE
jgi:hypothetical protein